MSGCSVAISRSRWRRYGLLASGVVLFLVFCIQPLSLLTLCLAAPLLCGLFWYGLIHYQQEPVAAGLSVDAQGKLHWWQSSQPGGQLLAGCLVSEFILLVRWQSDDNRQLQQWLLADQFTIADYRALARQLNQLNWQHLPTDAAGPS